MSDDAETQRIIGQLQASVEGLQKSVEVLQTQVGRLTETIASAKGGWRTLISVAGVSTAIGAAVAGFVHRVWP